MIAAGELGEIIGFRGIHAEGYMADPEVALDWRLDPAGGAGAVADLGSHIIGMARFLLGPINELFADLETVVKTRPVAAGGSETKAGGGRRHRPPDRAVRARLPRHDRGELGRDRAHDAARLRGDRQQGLLAFSQERLNEFHYYRTGGTAPGVYPRIEAGPQHEPYGRFCVAPGHQLGFNDLKTIEMAEFLASIAGGPTAPARTSARRGRSRT